MCGVVTSWHVIVRVGVCSLQSPVCSPMSACLASSLAQISVKGQADEAADGCAVLGCLVCLSGSVEHVLISSQRHPCWMSAALPRSPQCSPLPAPLRWSSGILCRTLYTDYFSCLGSFLCARSGLSQSNPRCTCSDAPVLFLPFSLSLKEK